MLFFITVAVFLASADAKFYKNCGSNLTTVESVVLNNCADDARECILNRKTNATITIDFTPSVNDTITNIEAHGMFDIPFRHRNTCLESDLGCPIKARTQASYSISLPVLKSYPRMRGHIKLEFKNKDNEVLVCIIIAARIR